MLSVNYTLHLHRLHHHWQPLLGRRDRQEDCEGSFNSTQNRSQTQRARAYTNLLHFWAQIVSWAPRHAHENGYSPYIDKRTGTAASTLARLTARVWRSPKLSVKTKMVVYNACVTSTLLYGSYICRAGEKAQHIPPEKHPPYPGHILAGQNNQRWCHVSCWSSRYVHSARTTQTAIVRSCPPCGGWPHSKRHPLRWAGIGEENRRPPSPAI